jgi:hypothetical protein
VVGLDEAASVGHHRPELGFVAEQTDLPSEGDDLPGIVDHQLVGHPRGVVDGDDRRAHRGADAEPQEQVLQVVRQSGAAQGRDHAAGLVAGRVPDGGGRAQRPVEERRQLAAGQPEHGPRHPALGRRPGDAVVVGEVGDGTAGCHVPRAGAPRQHAVDDPHAVAGPPVLDVGSDLGDVGPQPGTELVTAGRHHQVREHQDLVDGQAVAAEDRDRRGHPDRLARRQVGQWAPPAGREERVAGGGADLPARARPHAVDGLVAVVDEGVGSDRAQLAAVGQRQHRHRTPGEAGPMQVGGRDQLAGVRIDDARVPRDALAHRRAATDDHEVAGLEARQQLVEVDVAGRHAGDGVAPTVQLLQPVEVEAQQVLDLGGRVGHAPLVDVVDHRFGAVECLGDVLGHRVTDLGDLAGDADQPSEQCVLLDDARVPGGVGGGRRGRHDVDQDLMTPDGLE